MPALDFESALVDACLLAPFPILLMAPDRQSFWMNRYLAAWLHREPGLNQIISEDQLPHPSLKSLFDPDCDQFEAFLPGEPVRLWVRTRATLDTGNWEAHFFNDLSEQQRLYQQAATLRKQVQSLETKDQETGLLNRNAILHALDCQISRSRRYGNPLSVIKLQIHNLEAAPAAQTGLRSVTEEINHRLRWADQMGRMEANCFLLVLPETPFAEADKLASRLTDRQFLFNDESNGLQLLSAVTDWQRGDDARRLLQRLDVAYP
jgi:GGDEF domain-containing protein